MNYEWKPFSGALPAALTGLGATPTRVGQEWWARTDDGTIMRYEATGFGAVGFGALSDDAVQQAGGALLQHLQSAGCQPGYDPTVQAFQQAYVAAGGNLPADSNGGSGIDGLYGANTQAALQSVLNASPVNQPPQQAPAGCVSAAAGGGTPQSAQDILDSNTNIFGLSPTMFWILAGGIVVAGGLIAWSIWGKHTGGSRAHSYRRHAHEQRKIAGKHLVIARRAAHAAALEDKRVANESRRSSGASRRRRRSRRSRR